MAVPRERTPDALRAFLGQLSSGTKERCFVRWYCSGGQKTKQMVAIFEDGALHTKKVADVDLNFTRLDLEEDVQDYKGSGKGLRDFYLTEINELPYLRRNGTAFKLAEAKPGTAVCYDGGNGYWKSLLAHIEQFIQYVETGEMPDGKKRESAKAPQQPKKRAKTKVEQSNAEEEDVEYEDVEYEDAPPQEAEATHAEVTTPAAALAARANPEPAKAKPVATAVGTAIPMPAPTRGQQMEAYCGLNVKLVEFARRRYGDKPGGMNARAVRKWYEAHPEELPEHLKCKSFGNKKGCINVCHIISKAKGGSDWVANYVICTHEVNHFFAEYMPREWDQFIGAQAKEMAQSFAMWVAKKAAANITFGSFDPVADFFLARGR